MSEAVARALIFSQLTSCIVQIYLDKVTSLGATAKRLVTPGLQKSSDPKIMTKMKYNYMALSRRISDKSVTN